jgi:hypothetical protein
MMRMMPPVSFANLFYNGELFISPVFFRGTLLVESYDQSLLIAVSQSTASKEN